MKALLSYQKNCTGQNIAKLLKPIFSSQDIEVVEAKYKKERDFKEEPIILINNCDFIVSICTIEDDRNYWEKELKFVQDCKKPAVLITRSSLLSDCSFMNGVWLIFIKDEWQIEAGESFCDSASQFQISCFKAMKEIKIMIQLNYISFDKMFESLEKRVKLYNKKLEVREGQDRSKRCITEVQAKILAGLWKELKYPQIAKELDYAPSTISKDYVPRLWRFLEDVLEIDAVNRGNFRPLLEQMYRDSVADVSNY